MNTNTDKTILPQTDTAADRLKQRYAHLTELIAQRTASVLGEALQKTLISALDEYNNALLASLTDAEHRYQNLHQENADLRGLIGISDTEIRAKYISQAEEIRFLHEQLLALKKEHTSLDKKLAQVQLEHEALKVDFNTVQKSRADEKEQYAAAIKKLGEEAKVYTIRVKEKESTLDDTKSAVEATIRRTVNEVNAAGEEELFAVATKLNAFCEELREAARTLEERSRGQSDAITRTGLLLTAAKKKTLSGPAREIADQADALFRRADETVEMVAAYMRLFAPVEPVYAPVDWLKVWDALRRKFGDRAKTRKISLRFPQEKKYPLFATDVKLLTQICEIVVANALEALPATGVIELSATFMPDSLTLRFIDNGPGITPEHRGKVFHAFFTTKQGRYGFGLRRARLVARALGGDIVYEPLVTGSVFALIVPAQAITPREKK